MKHLSIFLFLLTGIAFSALSQSNPVPFDLSSGNYSFQDWPPTSPAGTFPSNMVFHFSTSPTAGSFNPLLPGTGDWDCNYNMPSRNRFNGLGTDGISILATSSGQFSDCGSDTANTSGRFVGSVVLALNSTGRENLTVSFLGGMKTVGDGGANARQFSLRLQYRVGTTGNFTDLPGPVEYSTVGQAAGHSQVFSNIQLPSMLNNEPEVQLRWVYFQTVSGSGSRPEIRLDEIAVSSTLIGTPTPVISVSPGTLPPFNTNAIGAPSSEASFSVSGTNLVDSISVSAPVHFEVSLTAGSSFMQNLKIPFGSGTVSNFPVYVRYHPQAGNSASGVISVSSSGAPGQQVSVSGTVDSVPVIAIPDVCINEFMASNSNAIEDEFDEFDDWVELHNYGASDVDLAGMYFTDNPNNPTKYQFPSGYSATLIPAGGFVLIWADGQPHQGPLHTSFSLSASGEFIGLVGTDGSTFIDSLTFGPQTTNVSYGRTTDCGNVWDFFSQHTAGLSNLHVGFGKTVSPVNQKLVISPNPVAQGAKVTFNKPTAFVLYNAYGKKIMESTHKIQELETTILLPGWYFVKTNQGEFQKLIVF